VPKDASDKSDLSCNLFTLALTRNGPLGQSSDITFRLSRFKKGGGEFFNTRFNFKMDLLRNSRVETQLNVVNAVDEVKAEAEAFATATITSREDAEHFEPTDDALDVTLRNAVVTGTCAVLASNIPSYNLQSGGDTLAHRASSSCCGLNPQRRAAFTAPPT